MLKNIYEIFDEVGRAASKKDAILVLQYNQTYTLKSVLKGMFDPRVKFAITEIPPYKKSDAPPGLGYNSLHQEIHRAYLFVEGEPRAANLTPKRREEILIQILEVMESREAEVFTNMLMKKHNAYKGITLDTVKKAFPDILPA
jgi:hypothetical protein